ncbi:hypothetical protein, partial [Pseudomonas aeruginosa]|uniref:hypothetical protein n=1 Tax=Pseudomonas aeruginosa TaxID=287 RepID=UPI001FD1F813
MALENRCGTEKRRVFTGVGPITLDLAKGCAKVFRRLRKKNLLMTKSTFYRHISVSYTHLTLPTSPPLCRS